MGIAQFLSPNPMLNFPWIIVLSSFIAAFLFASLVEYWIHRLMHLPLALGQRHRDHHRRNQGQGVIWEFLSYLKGASVLILLPFFWSWTIGGGWATGAIVYAAFSAYAHQLQHDNPTQCFWMKMPVHYVHHKYGMWHHNFGLGLDWWDHLFGTYKAVDWLTAEELEQRNQGHDQSRGQLRWW
jgi:sterol desaturase/sphingolipid hydroxylase (fatty acid hydroxylase superfamily)